MKNFKQIAFNGKAARIIGQMLRDEITTEEALQKIARSECVVGAHGICTTHGQVITECQEKT